jgi:hypothetical protein
MRNRSAFFSSTNPSFLEFPAWDLFRAQESANRCSSKTVSCTSYSCTCNLVENCTIHSAATSPNWPWKRQAGNACDGIFALTVRAMPSSKHRGVSWDKATGKWKARISRNGVPKILGRFAEEEEADRDRGILCYLAAGTAGAALLEEFLKFPRWAILYGRRSTGSTSTSIMGCIALLSTCALDAATRPGCGLHRR